MPMTERNKLLAEAFGECWHKKSDVDIHQCKNCDSEIIDTSLISQSIEYLRPDYFTLVTLVCDKCGGTGKDYCSGEWQDGENIDCEKDCPLNIENPPENGPCLIPCPCQSKPRIISRLQHEIEKRGEWDAFCKWFCDQYFDGLHSRSIDDLTDLIKMADAYLEWRKV